MSTIKYQKNKPGFTITELVVAAGIIAMISVMVVVNFRGANQKAALDNEAERLSTILRQANINSLIVLIGFLPTETAIISIMTLIRTRMIRLFSGSARWTTMFISIRLFCRYRLDSPSRPVLIWFFCHRKVWYS